MQTIFYPANERGHADYGWLKTHHSFSFGNWYDATKLHFGALRVLNDDIVLGGEGFGTHPHANMEIVTIPLSGALAHKDSTGTSETIETGEVQMMSAGKGITHSEFNASKTEPVSLLQIWVLPKLKNIEPRYAQKKFAVAERANKWQIVVGGDADGLPINQDTVFALANLDEAKSLTYTTQFENSGLFVFVIEGSLKVQDIVLENRDALGIWETSTIELNASSKSQILLIEVPMLNLT
jgi:quercetin 2,3-dioxygenase